MTIFYPDISVFQAGVNLTGALVVCAKATESTNYTNPDYATFKAGAKAAGAVFVAYNFLHAGNGAAQAAYCFDVVGKSTPLMIDPRPSVAPTGGLIGDIEHIFSPHNQNRVLGPEDDLARYRAEPTGSSFPTLTDVTTFCDTYRKLGGVCWLVYLPEWYWAEAPMAGESLAPLVTRGLKLVSSTYGTYTDAATGAGWKAYGGMTPTIWQYSDSTPFGGLDVDFNAYRGSYAGKQDAVSVKATVAEFERLVTTGNPNPPTPPPVPPVVIPNGGTEMPFGTVFVIDETPAPTAADPFPASVLTSPVENVLVPTGSTTLSLFCDHTNATVFAQIRVAMCHGKLASGAPDFAVADVVLNDSYPHTVKLPAGTTAVSLQRQDENVDLEPAFYIS